MRLHVVPCAFTCQSERDHVSGKVTELFSNSNSWLQFSSPCPYLSVPLSLSLSLHSSVPIPLSLPMSLCLYPLPPFSLSLPISLSPFPFLHPCFCPSVPVSVPFIPPYPSSLSLSLYFCPCFSVPIPLSVLVPVPMGLSLSLCLAVSVSSRVRESQVGWNRTMVVQRNQVDSEPWYSEVELSRV